MPPRIAIVEDDEFTRAMLVQSLRGFGYQVPIETSRPKALLDYLDVNGVDVALLDLHLGKGPSGLELAVAIRQKLPSVGIVILTSYEDPRLMQSNPPPLPHGTVYVIKRDVGDLKLLSDAIEKAVEGAKAFRQKNPSKTQGTLSSLTNGQIELLRLMAQGLSNAEIAKRRFITEKAVELAISRLVKTMGIERDPTQNQRVHIAKVYFRAMGLNLAEDV